MIPLEDKLQLKAIAEEQHLPNLKRGAEMPSPKSPPERGFGDSQEVAKKIAEKAGVSRSEVSIYDDHACGQFGKGENIQATEIPFCSQTKDMVSLSIRILPSLSRSSRMGMSSCSLKPVRRLSSLRFMLPCSCSVHRILSGGFGVVIFRTDDLVFISKHFFAVFCKCNRFQF
jgi:hypothetical protein